MALSPAETIRTERAIMREVRRQAERLARIARSWETETAPGYARASRTYEARAISRLIDNRLETLRSFVEREDEPMEQ